MKKYIKIIAIVGMILAAVVYGLRSGGYLREGVLFGARDSASETTGIATAGGSTDAADDGGMNSGDSSSDQVSASAEAQQAASDSSHETSAGDTQTSYESSQMGAEVQQTVSETGHGASAESTKTSAESAQPDTKNTQTFVESTQPAIMVHVCGCVNSPGVYGFAEGARLYEAIEAAGGFTEDADETYMNLAAYLSDGIKVYVPAEGEIVNGTDAAGAEYSQTGAVSSGNSGGAGSMGTSGSGSNGAGTGISDGKVDINTAGETELQTLPGIGPSRAADIISYRKKNGAFYTIEDIMNVPGIKEAAFSKIKDMIVAR